MTDLERRNVELRARVLELEAELREARAEPRALAKAEARFSRGAPISAAYTMAILRASQRGGLRR